MDKIFERSSWHIAETQQQIEAQRNPTVEQIDYPL